MTDATLGTLGTLGDRPQKRGPTLRERLWPATATSTQPQSATRLEGALVDTNRPLSFTFDGRRMQGFAGDTLASALIANGQKLVARSFKYHRPRGILTAGSEEPNALVTLGDGALRETNTRATVVPLFDGLAARSQNHVGSLRFDAMAAADLAAPMLGAGFYYKTFMWPAAFWEKVYEPAIRRAAGLGAISTEPDPNAYDHAFAHCDVLVVGAGPAGLAAARAAARAGASVILADEDQRVGGRLLADTNMIDDVAGVSWADVVAGELDSLPRTRVMTGTTVVGAFDHGVHVAITDHGHAAARSGAPRMTVTRIYAKQTIIAAGATERPIAFANNDRPGIMMASAVRAYVNRFGVAPGTCTVVYTATDDGWRTARDLVDRGQHVAAVIDARPKDDVSAHPIEGVEGHYETHVVSTRGRLGLTTLLLSDGREVFCDCLAVSGGWNPNVQLTCHKRGRPEWREEIAAFVPSAAGDGSQAPIGAAAGTFGLGQTLKDGHRAGLEAAASSGFRGRAGDAPAAESDATGVSAFFYVGESRRYGRAWLDFQNDVTAKDIGLAHLEGFRSVEHAKRYTTLGMATDQGKTANVLGISLLAEAAGTTIAETGTTIYRPPYTPVPIGAFAGRARGKAFRPTRKTAGHDWAADAGASFVEAGAWLRAEWFTRDGEMPWRQSVDREVNTVRNAVGICDVSTLGKIDVQGRDAAVFLDSVYANTMSSLKVGRTRYGLMLREDGIVFDDGTAARFREDHFLVTTTTANAGRVFEHLEFCHQGLWPDLDVRFESVTDHWFQVAIAGPSARALLERVVDDLASVTNDAFPFMACGETTVCGGTPARLFRVSFSGELGYELALPSRFGASLMARLAKAGADLDCTPYGVEALNVLRIEKGHVSGGELNGQTTARALGLGRMVSDRKDCIGGVLRNRPHLVSDDDPILVGFKPIDGESELTAGAHFFATGAEQITANDEGHMTSVCYSPTLGSPIGLGLLLRGPDRIGETVVAADPVRNRAVEVEVCSPHFFDPEGARLRG